MIWSYTYNPLMWPALITLALVTFLGWYSWRRRNVSGATPFAIGCLFAMLWALGAVLETSAVDLSTRVFWVKFQVAWQLPAVTALTWFALVYAAPGRWLTRRNLILLSIPPLLLLVIIITNDYHHLMWTGFRVDEIIVPIPGGANRIFLGYAFILGLMNVIVFLWMAIRSPQHRWPVAIMVFGQVAGRGVYLLDYLYGGSLGPEISILFVVGLLSAMYAIALFRFHVFDPVPLARSAVIEQMSEGMVVLDLHGKIVDLNTAAARIWGKSAATLKGQVIRELLSADLNLLGPASKANLAPFEIGLGSGKDLRYYSLNITSLVDKRDQLLGQLILLHEITEEKRKQAQIAEQQQAVATLRERERLARELHDSTGQVLGYVNLQAETIRKWLQTGNNEKAESLLIRLAEVAKEAHTDIRESILSLKSGSAQGWSFLPALKRYLNDFQSHYAIRTELVLKDALDESSFKPDAEVQLLRVIQEAMTNTRKHSGAHNLRVSIEQEESWGRITVTDDGSGFDPGKLNQDTSRRFGLGFMRERMEQIGGSVKIDSRPGEGTTVKLEAPIWNTREEIT